MSLNSFALKPDGNTEEIQSCDDAHKAQEDNRYIRLTSDVNSRHDPAPLTGYLLLLGMYRVQRRHLPLPLPPCGPAGAAESSAKQSLHVVRHLTED